MSSAPESLDRSVDLSNCDREPIHKLGAIQDFGALIAVTSDWMVAHRSANTAQILSGGEQVEVGIPLDRVFDSEAMKVLRRATSLLVGDDDVERLFAIDLLGGREKFDCSLHATGDLVVLEIEPSSHEGFDRQLRMIQPIMRQLEPVDDLEELCRIAADRLKDMLGFDRVMVYRFHPDGSGDVIAEAREDHLEAFLGLRYPHTDIPKQARALYLRNRFRIISDIEADPVPIEPEQVMGGGALDLSMSTLRAVSPIHIEYLRNMGVGASLSISIIVRGELWGLFACHHYSAKVLPYSLRTTAELFSELFSLMVERVYGRAEASFLATGREMHDRLMRAVAGGNSLVGSLPELRPIIQRVIPHDGISVYVDGHYDSRGSAPNSEEFRALIPMLNAAASSRVIATECLTERIPQAEVFADRAAGALIIPISRSPRDYFVLWRRELRQVVTWAGNPVKSVETGPNGDRLTPRKSFEAWQQSVEGCAKEWSPTERQISESLRVTLLEVILRLTDEAVQERAKAQQQQELLISELNHRVRNILNLIRGLINQSRHEAIDVEAFAKLIGGRINALAIAHDNITRENWSPASLVDLIQSEAEAYVSGKMDRLIISGEEALVSPEAYTVLALVFHEMITNSVKYGSLCDRSGTLEIDVRCDESGMTVLWKERGGPPVKPPERRGFGTTIIEKSIPFELNGRAQVDYKLSGVEAEFWIPGRFITCQPNGGARERRRNGGDRAQMQGKIGVKNVLVVEDSMIIAIDTEECLLDLGAKDVAVQGTVAGALNAISAQPFDLALLDFNLGNESSEKIAEVLREKGVPFWLATGYGEMSERLEELGAQGLLVKPYGREELAKMLRDYAARDAS
ncbi:HWE histidine kinase domain-containing protein [Qipengyuania sp.]|uniref:HWE histidine kinase domain-containing protein n=1 Tax=Qipengyuania sp. TaxID=2004515 RepID=UPI0035C7BF90